MCLLALCGFCAVDATEDEPADICESINDPVVLASNQD